jgi:hypothetical protein
MSARTQSLLPVFLLATGVLLMLIAAIWSFWPRATPTQNVAYRSRPAPPIFIQAPQTDPNATASVQFWLEDQADAYARELTSASGENRRILEALLNRTLAELAVLKTQSDAGFAPSPARDGGLLIHVRATEN